MTLASEARRPGISKLYNRLKKQHSDWPDHKCIAMAKMLYCNEKIAVERDSKMIEVPNPDYRATRDR